MAFKVYIFTNEEAAQAAVAAINAGEGYPLPGATTTSYTDYHPFEGGFFIFADEVTRKYITGNEFEIELEDES